MLTAKAEKGGVKGMAAQNELIILEKGDMTETNRIELTLQVNIEFRLRCLDRGWSGVRIGIRAVMHLRN